MQLIGNEYVEIEFELLVSDYTFHTLISDVARV